ncbi:hypothetical protein U1Q18_003282 [Sarracenia purpurea var. burkii]
MNIDQKKRNNTNQFGVLANLESDEYERSFPSLSGNKNDPNSSRVSPDNIFRKAELLPTIQKLVTDVKLAKGPPLDSACLANLEARVLRLNKIKESVAKHMKMDRVSHEDSKIRVKGVGQSSPMISQKHKVRKESMEKLKDVPLPKEGGATSGGAASKGATMREAFAPLLVRSSPEVSKDEPKVAHKDEEEDSNSDSGEEVSESGKEDLVAVVDSGKEASAKPSSTEQGIPHISVLRSSPKVIKDLDVGGVYIGPVDEEVDSEDEVVDPGEYEAVYKAEDGDEGNVSEEDASEVEESVKSPGRGDIAAGDVGSDIKVNCVDSSMFPGEYFSVVADPLRRVVSANKEKQAVEKAGFFKCAPRIDPVSTIDIADSDEGTMELEDLEDEVDEEVDEDDLGNTDFWTSKCGHSDGDKHGRATGHLQSIKRKFQGFATQPRGVAAPAAFRSVVDHPVGRFAPSLTSTSCNVPSLSPAVKASLLGQAVEGAGKQII